MDQADPVDQRDQTDQIGLREYWNVIRRHKAIIMSVFLVVVVAVMLKSLTMIPLYRATTQVLIERANPNVLSTEELLTINPSGSDFYQTQYKILESRSLARDVIRRTNLANHPEYKPEKLERGFISTFFTPVQEWIKMPVAWLKSSLQPDLELADEDAYRYPIASSGGEEGNVFVSAVLSRLDVKPIRNSRLVDISFESAYPALAAKVANALVESYIDWNLSLRLKSQQEASRFLDEQVKASKRKLETSELALQQYREKYGVAALGAHTAQDGGLSQDLSRQKLAKVNDQLLDATNKRIAAEIEYKQAAALLKDESKAESIPAVVESSVIIEIKRQEVGLLREKAEKAQKYGTKHPAMTALNQEIEKINRQKMQEIRNIVDSLMGKYKIALSQEQSLRQALGISQNETINRDKIAIQYQVLQQEVDSSRSLYDMLLKRMKETSVSEENRSVNIHVIDRAEVPKQYYKPKLKQNFFLAAIVGLFLGIGFAFLIEYLDDTVKKPEDIERLFNLPYLGPVPHFDHSGDEPENELITLRDPQSSASESYRGIRTGILFSTPGKTPRTILVTSPGVGAGKSVTAANIAVVMAQSGTKVLLLDVDMRKPRQHRIFGKKNEKGLTNILVGEEDWRPSINNTSIPGLDYISVGPIPPNPAELVGSKRMREVVETFLEHYDRVILDSSPIMAVTDPMVLSKLVDGVVLVLNAGVVTKEQVKRARQQLRNVQANILGVVLNNIDTAKGNYYYNYHYYHYYTEDGSKSKHRRRKSNA
ncbi:MAG: polysaccharide biosynthesis tyrosine autokinase [Deltaproteobacteria bacterium]|nr:polysaccharide biosynthesis tyrosine autokinase [Deltaproteobacteria bacterium]